MIKKGTYRHRHRSLKNKQHKLNNSVSHSTRIIHVSIRSTPKTASTNEVKTISPKNTQPIPIMTNHHHYHNESLNESRSTDLHQYSRSVLEENRSNSNRISPEFNNHSVTPNNSSKLIESKIFHPSPSRLGITREHHNSLDRKNKKKSKRNCIIISVIIGILLLLPIIIVPSILLTRTKTKMNPPEAKLRWNSSGITVAGITGLSGSANDRLNTPINLIIDHLNTLYIADYSCHRIQRWFNNASSGTTVAGNKNCTLGTTLSELNYPTNVLLDSDNNMYITDQGFSRIVLWAHNATSGRIIAGTGFAGNANNELYSPFSLARDSNSGTIYIADTYNHRIMRYLLNATSGIIVAGGNGVGQNSSQLYSPTNVYFESSLDSLIILNYNLNNIVRWKIGDNGWTLIAGSINGSVGSTSTLFHSPTSMTFDPMGNMYVADLLNHRIQFFLSGDSIGTTIAGVSTIPGNNATHLNTAYGVALDNQLNLYVADSANHRIQKFVRY